MRDHQRGRAGLDRSSGSADYSSDGIHPSLIGYAKLANVWFGAIDPLVLEQLRNA